MRNNGLPDNDEWKKIVDEAFSSDEIHTFSEHYRMKKQSMRKGITMKRNNLIMNLTVAAAALAVVAFPTGIYLATRTAETTPATELPADEIETTSEDEVTVTDETDEEFVTQISDTEVTITDGEDDGQVNEDIHQFTDTDVDYDTIYDLEYGWLPEGLEYQDEDSPYCGKFHNWKNKDGMTPAFIKVPEGMTFSDSINYVADTQEWLLDGKTVKMNYRNSYDPENKRLNFGRIAVIYFDNTPYILELYVTDGISEEDFRKIIDNVKLVPSEEETAGIYAPPEETDEELEARVNAHDPGQTEVFVYQIDDDITIDYDLTNHISIKVDDVSFDKDFDSTTDVSSIRLYNENYVDENGHLVDNVRKWVRYGNGFDVDYEELESEVVPTSIMTVTLTYTNTGDLPLDTYATPTSLFTKHNDKFYTPLYINMLEHFGFYEDVYLEYEDTFDALRQGSKDISLINYASDKNISSLAKGESAQVICAFIVEDKFRDNLYLDLGYFSDHSSNTEDGFYIVDISNAD